jgi:protocatechuate 3,4-dioxygenase beta subunit
MTDNTPTRRSLITRAFAALGLSALAKPLSAAGLTPRAMEGPFYPTASMRRADVDNDLVKLIGAVQEAGGEVITLTGRILDQTGTPRAGHRIEIWQCDTNGKYLHSGDRQSIPFDPAFQGFGHDITDADGRYVFRTIKPVTYPGRTPHIHVKVFDKTQEILTTQFYIDGHPANRQDRLFNRMSEPQAQAVSMVFEPTDQGGEIATLDVVI